MMKVSEIVRELQLDPRAGLGALDNDVRGGYASDLLSDVMANSNEGDIWVTLQGHPNIIAIATMRELAGIIIANSRQPEEDTVERADEEDIPVLCSSMPTFQVVGKLYAMGITGLR
jgi:hypothetical protein